VDGRLGNAPPPRAGEGEGAAVVVAEALPPPPPRTPAPEALPLALPHAVGVPASGREAEGEGEGDFEAAGEGEPVADCEARSAPLGEPLGEDGEIRVRTPSLLKGYWNRPEATAEAIVDGWLRTGDIGLIDTDGFLHFLGRKKEMLKVKGMSVVPPEIEAVLGQHPAVLGSGVIGRSDAQRGEVPVAFVLLQPGADAATACTHHDNRQPVKTPGAGEFRHLRCPSDRGGLRRVGAIRRRPMFRRRHGWRCQ
jgi:acyl-CoA synthetase (AMP-forming)/AMP-acid ligase II